MIEGFNVPSSIELEDKTLIKSDSLYNSLFFRYTLVFIRGFSFMSKLYHNIYDIKRPKIRLAFLY